MHERILPLAPEIINRTRDATCYALSQRPGQSLIPHRVGVIRAMGRSFISVRLGVKSIADRWARVSRARRYQDRKYCNRLVEFAKRHSSEAFVGCDDPLEAAIFSVLVELHKKLDDIEQHPWNQGEP